jgi:hypothetical protein
MAEKQGKAGRRPVEGAAAGAPAVIADAGTHLMVSGPSEKSVLETTQRLVAQGRTVTSPPARMGNKWIATVDKPEVEGATVATFGLRRMITGPTRESVEVKVAELQEFGAVLLHDIECIDGVWTAVCEKS